MAKNKTTETLVGVDEFLSTVEHTKRRADGIVLLDIFREVTGFEPKMWGPSIIGFGKYHYKYASGHEGEAPMAGFSPRKDSLVIYMASDFKDRDELLAKLGKHRSSKVCIYVKKLEDIDISVLKTIILNSMEVVCC